MTLSSLATGKGFAPLAAMSRGNSASGKRPHVDPFAEAVFAVVAEALNSGAPVESMTDSLLGVSQPEGGDPDLRADLIFCAGGYVLLMTRMPGGRSRAAADFPAFVAACRAALSERANGPNTPRVLRMGRLLAIGLRACEAMEGQETVPWDSWI